MPDGSGALPSVVGARRRAAEALLREQGADGSWEGEVVWCPVITAQVAIAREVLGAPPDKEWRRLALRHFAVTQHPDGGWGLHGESAPFRFVTTMVYVAARLLGEDAEAPWLRRARAWLDGADGDVYGLPSWGKFWLSLLGLYDRSGLNPCPPELFLLPAWLPFSPDRLYCHTRSIYLGMATLAAAPARDPGPLGTSLRAELGLDGRPAVRHRHDLVATDAFVRPGRLLRSAYDAMRWAGRIAAVVPGRRALRRRAIARCVDRLAAEARATRFQGLSPVSGVLAAMALSQAGRPEADPSLAGLESWAWCDEGEGLRHAGARSTTWDTAFVVQALLAAPLPATEAALRRAHARLRAMQEPGDLPPGSDPARQAIRGGWCFSDGTHRWPVSDCTAEALTAILGCEAVAGLIAPAERIPVKAVADALRFLMDRQNADGGFGTYERRRAGAMLERLNPSEMFGQCMTELSYVECTASALAALSHARARSPAAAAVPGLSEAMRRAEAFLLASQRPDGSWPGFWGVNVIYGTLFAVTGLAAAGMEPQAPPLRQAAAWLRSVQNEDGGWGEHFSGCLQNRYVPASGSRLVGTSWAVLALCAAEGPRSDAARRGAAWLAARQDASGTWSKDAVTGVFFGTAMLDYRLYDAIFPAWALAKVEP